MRSPLQMTNIWNSPFTEVSSDSINKNYPDYNNQIGFESISKPAEYQYTQSLQSSACLISRIAELSNLDLRLLKPIPLYIEFYGETVVAYNTKLEQFGYGESVDEAKSAFLNCIEDLFEILTDEEENLGKVPRKQLNALKEYIEGI